MFKRDIKGEFVRDGFSIFTAYYFRSGKYKTPSIGKKEGEAILQRQLETPVIVMSDTHRKEKWWMFQGEFYYENEGYSDEEVKALILEDTIRREKKIRKAVSTVEQKERLKNFNREPIPEAVQQFVWKRDDGKCVKCGSNKKLEFDHIIPLSKGGSNTERNLQLLCEQCNRQKSANI